MNGSHRPTRREQAPALHAPLRQHRRADGEDCRVRRLRRTAKIRTDLHYPSSVICSANATFPQGGRLYSPAQTPQASPVQGEVGRLCRLGGVVAHGIASVLNFVGRGAVTPQAPLREGGAAVGGGGSAAITPSDLANARLPVSLRLGPLAALTAHWAVIHYRSCRFATSKREAYGGGSKPPPYGG